VKFVETKLQLVDIFTKPLPKERFFFLRNELGILDLNNRVPTRPRALTRVSTGWDPSRAQGKEKEDGQASGVDRPRALTGSQPRGAYIQWAPPPDTHG